MRQHYICLPFASEAQYQACVDDPTRYRQYLTAQQAAHPELFPAAMSAGYSFHSAYELRKVGVVVRRIKLKANGVVFTLRPSFVLPYGVARTAEVEKALYLRQFGVPFTALAYVFGHDAMFWYRVYLQLGQVNLVGATVKDETRMPVDLVADEKITWVQGAEVSVPTTVGGGCFLGVSVVAQEDQAALQVGYGAFATEAQAVFPAYVPQSVCTDGWAATQAAWRALFPTLTLVLCYLHAVLKIAACCTGDLRTRVLTRAWEAYHAPTKAAFAQRLRRLREWGTAQLTGPVAQAVEKLCRRRAQFTPAYDCPTAARTSNAVDRLLNHLDRQLYSACYGHSSAAQLTKLLRAVAVQWNFHPYGPRLRHDQPTRVSPFHDLNGFVYHANWLHNLLIASSMGGFRL
jgi:hypothetical protein